MSKSFLIAGAVALNLLASSVAAESVIQYTTLTGYFLQDDVASDPSTFDYVNIKVLPICFQLMTT
jgi:hypothetical protein